MPIKAVLFDLGDTLIESSLSKFETFQKILEHQGIQVSLEEIEQAFITAKEELGNPFEQLVGKIPYLEFYQLWDSHVLKALKVEDNGELAKKIIEQWYTIYGITLFPDVIPLLTMLREKGIKTGIVSNAYEEEIHQICAVANLGNFDIIVGSDTARKAKPDPEIFVYALKLLGVQPEETVYVGNDVEKDYKGAERAGMNPLLIVREGAKVLESVEYIRCLMDLTGYVDK